MPETSDYVCDIGSPYAQLKAATNSVPKNVHSGSINSRGPPGSYYSDGSRAVISARTIAEFADYSTLPDDHPLYEPESRGVGTGRTPRETDRIWTYTAARGSAYHLYKEMPADSEAELEEIVRRELDSPPVGDEWVDVHETVAESDAAPHVDSPALQKDSYETLVQRICWEIVDASRIHREKWGNVDAITIGKEVNFIAELNGYRWGGRVDRINIVKEASEVIDQGAFATELKFTNEIRPRDIVQTELYRHAFDDFSYADRPLDAVVVRVDIESETCEVKSSLDEDWPGEEAWKQFCSGYDRYYDNYHNVDAWLQRSTDWY